MTAFEFLKSIGFNIFKVETGRYAGCFKSENSAYYVNFVDIAIQEEITPLIIHLGFTGVAESMRAVGFLTREDFMSAISILKKKGYGIDLRQMKDSNNSRAQFWGKRRSKTDPKDRAWLGHAGYVKRFDIIFDQVSDVMKFGLELMNRQKIKIGDEDLGSSAILSLFESKCLTFNEYVKEDNI